MKFLANGCKRLITTFKWSIYFLVKFVPFNQESFLAFIFETSAINIQFSCLYIIFSEKNANEHYIICILIVAWIMLVFHGVVQTVQNNTTFDQTRRPFWNTSNITIFMYEVNSNTVPAAFHIILEACVCYFFIFSPNYSPLKNVFYFT